MMFCDTKVFLWFVTIIVINVKFVQSVLDKRVSSIFFKSRTNPKILYIGNKLLDVEIEINVLNTSLVNFYNIELFKKAAFMEKDLLELRKKIYNMKRIGIYTIYEQSIEQLKKFHITLTKRIEELKNKIEEFGSKVTITGVIEALKNYQLSAAEAILEYSNDPYFAIQLMVHTIYTNNTDNITTLLHFANALTTIDRSVMVVEHLYKEIKSSNSSSFTQMINFVSLLDSDVFKQTNSNSKEYTDATSVYKNIDVSYLSSKNKTSAILEMEMIKHTFAFNAKIGIFLAKLYNINATLSNEILFKVLDKIHGKISNSEILDNIFFKCSVAQKADALVYMYNKMKDLRELDNVMTKLVGYVYDVLKKKPSNVLVAVWNKLPSH